MKKENELTKATRNGDLQKVKDLLAQDICRGVYIYADDGKILQLTKEEGYLDIIEYLESCKNQE